MSQQAARASRTSASAPLGWARDDLWLALAGPGLLVIGHTLHGAMLPVTALAMTVAAAALVGAALARRGLREAVARLDGLGAPALLFAAVLGVVILSLTPWAPGGPHPVWAYLNLSPGAATIDRSQTLLEAVKLLGLACLFVLGVMTGVSDARARVAVALLLALTAVLGLWSFATFVSGVFGPDAVRRMEATFLSANTAGTLFACSLVLAAGPLTSALKNRPVDRRLSVALPFGLAALLFMVCLFATASRGAFGAAAAGFATFGALQMFSGRLKWSRGMLIGGGALAAVLLLAALAGDVLVTRLFQTSEAIASRGAIARIHWDAFLASPLMGYGLGTFDLVNRLTLDAGNFATIWPIRAVHNIYLSWLEQAGLLGAAPMFLCIAVLIAVTLRNALRRRRMTAVLFALIGADVVFLVHGLTDFALEMFSMAALWAYLLGLQFSLAQGSSNR